MAIRRAAEAEEFVTGWKAAGQKMIDERVETWREIMMNVLVEPDDDEDASVSNPYGKGREKDVRNLVLKDPESSQIAETFRANMMGALFSDPEGKYVQCLPRGYEDSKKADTTSRLLRYDFGLPGVQRTLSEAMLDLAMFGTVVLETPWREEERDVLVREVQEFNGVTMSQESRESVLTYDDPELNQIDLADWYPDPDETRIEKMRGAMKGFRMTPNTARAMAEDADSAYDAAAVEEAISSARKAHQRKEEQKRDIRRRRDSAQLTEFDEDFTEMAGYEYWGEVPFDHPDGVTRRVITMLNGVVVRNDPWPLTDPDLPFHVLVINPVKGRHYGKAPAEVVRYTQDFADAMLMLIAEATVRQVHPPIAIDISKDIDPSQVRAWDPDSLVAVDGDVGGAVQTLQYGSNVFQGTQFQQNLKGQMREGSGALGPVQGLGLGVNRASATEAGATFQKAMTQIEAAAQLLEKDGLPQIGRGLLRRNQQFLADTDELKKRVGELPPTVWIGDIMGDFDVQFVGTRNAVSKQMKLQAYDRLIALAQVMPQIFQKVPIDAVLADLFGDVLQLHELARIFAQAAAQQQDQGDAVQENVLLQMLQQAAQGQQGNGVPQSAQSPGLSPEAAAGAAIEE